MGLGDNIMAWTGLYALLINDVCIIDHNCTMYVPVDLNKLAHHVFSKYGIIIKSASNFNEVKNISPVFSSNFPNAKKVKEIYNTFIGPDWRINCFEEIDLQKNIPRKNIKETLKSKLRLNMSERIFYHRSSWKSAQPGYIGYRLWLPVTSKIGMMPVQFMALMKSSLYDFRLDIIEYINNIKSVEKDVEDVSIFPVGKSFQAFSPKFCEYLSDTLGPLKSIFYISKNDAWNKKYLEYNFQKKEIKSLEDTLCVIKNSNVLITTDSFSSHIAQIVRDDFILVLTRDFRENVLHPGASPQTVMYHPPCAPCNYISRSEYNECLAGYSNCLAFDQKYLISEIIKKIKTE